MSANHHSDMLMTFTAGVMTHLSNILCNDQVGLLGDNLHNQADDTDIYK